MAIGKELFFMFLSLVYLNTISYRTFLLSDTRSESQKNLQIIFFLSLCKNLIQIGFVLITEEILVS